MRRRMKLTTSREVRACLSRVVNLLLNEEIDPREANAVVAACNAILSALRTDEQEQKLAELERLISEMKQ